MPVPLFVLLIPILKPILLSRNKVWKGIGHIAEELMKQ